MLFPLRRCSAIVIALCLAACSVKDSEGAHSHKNPAEPRRGASCDRVVSLAPSITETLFALGLGDNIVGVTKYCEYPEAARHKPKVGGYLDPSVEAIVSLRPTLVMLLEEHAAVKPKLVDLGISTLALENHSLSEIDESIDRIARACQAESSAAALRAELARDTASVLERVKGEKWPRVLIIMGRNMGSGGISDVFIAGRNIFFSDLIRAAGGLNAYDGDVPVPLVSQEGIIAMNPEVIVDLVPKSVGENRVTASEAAADWQGLPVDAVRSDRVYIFEAPYHVLPGPRYVRILEDLADVLHGKAVRP